MSLFKVLTGGDLPHVSRYLLYFSLLGSLGLLSVFQMVCTSAITEDSIIAFQEFWTVFLLKYSFSSLPTVSECILKFFFDIWKAKF